MTMPSDQPVHDPATPAGTPAAAPAGSPAVVGQPYEQPADDAMTLSAEQLVSQTTWVRTGAVRLRRRIVTEQRTISTQVQVRREELVIESDGVEWDANGVAVGRLPGDAVAAPAGPPPPLVILLREEVPQVVLTVRPYERVTATVTPVTGQAPVTAQLSHEEIALEGADAPLATPPAGPALS